MCTRFAAATSMAVLVAACSGSDVVRPGDGSTPASPSFAISDAGNGGAVPGIWFLPPLAKQPTPIGTFDGGLQPSVQVCELDGNPSSALNPDWASVACTSRIVAEFAAGSATVTSDTHYQFSWDTDEGPQNLLPMDPERFYRINVLVEGAVAGYLDLNPQRPSGQSPGDDYPDLYAFRVGENLPVKVFLTTQVRCAGAEGYVIQCTASGVVDASGGVVTLDPVQPGWARLSVVVPAGALPAGYPSVVLTMERIHPQLYFELTGERCIPGLGYPLVADAEVDAPLFGDCLRVTTDPELPVELETAAIIEMCIDPFTLAGLKFDEEQDTRLQIIRYDDGETQGLPNIDAVTCGAPPQPGPAQLGFFPVPRAPGFLRTAAVTANTVARWLGPEPLLAHGDIRLGGATSEFSHFMWGLPGEMVKEAGDGTVVQQLEDGSESYDVTVRVRVQDSGSSGPAPSAIEGASVHFSGGGTVSPMDVTTLADGIAEVTWTLPGVAGTYALDATALGLLGGPVPDHDELIDFEEASVAFTATVVGAPSSATQSPASLPALVGSPGETLATPLTITVLDENGEPVVGWPVTWSTTCAAANPADCDGYVTGSTTTDASGMASGLWTLATTPGANTATVTVGSVTFAFVAGTWNANGVCQVVVDGQIGAGEWDCAAAAGDTRSFTANISGGGTPAEIRWQNDGTDIFFLVKVAQGSMDKVNSLRIDFDNTRNGPSADDDAIGFNPGGGGFFDAYLTQTCVNRSQAGCGSLDRVSRDGAGALGNDGAYTIYELRHPLRGTAGEDFVLAAGQRVGGFFTLRIGNGAQGNTQYPGFRNYLEMTIR